MPPEGCLPDLDMVIDKGKEIAELLGLDGDKIFPGSERKRLLSIRRKFFVTCAAPRPAPIPT